MQTQGTFLMAAASAAAICYVLYRRNSSDVELNPETARLRHVLSVSRRMSAGA